MDGATSRDALAEALMSALCESVIWEGRHVGELEEHICDQLADAILTTLDAGRAA